MPTVFANHVVCCCIDNDKVFVCMCCSHFAFNASFSSHETEVGLVLCKGLLSEKAPSAQKEVL